MKAFLIMTLITFNVFASDSGNIFKGAELAAKFQCSENVKDYDFISEYSSLFQFDTNDNISRDEESLRKLKEVSIFVEKNIADTCKSKKYLAGAWDFQGCLNKCNEAFKKKESLKNKCVTTCSSLKYKMNSLVYILGDALTKKIVFDNSKCKETPKSKINNSGRGKIKDNAEGREDRREASDTVGK